MTLQAAWLGSWKAPWPQTRGRRWGDWAWALQALAQAWLLGGDEGRWPQGSWEARRPAGPRPLDPFGATGRRPSTDWVALLRHGSAAVPAHRRGPRETEAVAQAWSALLDGDGTLWMALGSVLLDRPTRLRWIPLLGAVEANGPLRLPPFLQDLVPEGLQALPPGWWARLLGGMDGEGRLLPEGDLPLAHPWDRLRPALDGLVLPKLPEGLQDAGTTSWLVQVPGFGWMIDPALRAWGRGWGAAPEALIPLVPASLALGDPPVGPMAQVLAGRLVSADWPDPAWREAVQADLDGRPGSAPSPPPNGDPSLDRLRARWTGELPPTAPGYPAWGNCAHPCADPFHWMAEGRRAFRAQAFPGALQAFTLAHVHFQRLGAGAWAERAASNAALAAFQWADLPAHHAWQDLAGRLPSPYRELDEARWLVFAGQRDAAERRARDLVAAFPDVQECWIFLAELGLAMGRPEAVREGLPHISEPAVRTLLQGVLGDLASPPPRDLPPEETAQWRFHQVLRLLAPVDAFWEAWDRCPNHVLRLELGLDLLEARPEARTPERLLALQAIAERTAADEPLARLRGLWPLSEQAPDPDPRMLIQAVCAAAPAPLWVHWPEGAELARLGAGDPPPPGLAGCLREAGAVPPVAQGPWVWWGFPLVWEGASVGWVLAASHPEDPVAAPPQAHLLAPWVARLHRPEDLPPDRETGEFLTDGSEPMASVLRDLRRVAPSSLPVLMLGPSGSGKELLARELHAASGRTGQLVPVNCSAMAESLLESELFGHTKGAFTGADRERKGAVETANGGTLFIDEVADLSPRLQSMLLRVLQEREVRKVGSDRAVTVDVRFVAATHKDLEALAQQGRFRADLLFRLQGTVLRLPSLAQRAHELPWLLPRLVVRLAREQKRPVPELAPGLGQALARLPWPGNVRELRYAVERALLRCGEGPLRPIHFPELAAPPLETRTWEEGTRAFQRQLLRETLRRFGFKAADAAQALGLTRPALYTAAKRLGVDLAAERLEAGDA